MTVNHLIRFITFTVFCAIAFGSSFALAQGTCWDVRVKAHVKCNFSTPGQGVTHGSRGSNSPSGPSREEQERMRERSVHDWNEKGFGAYERGDWANAVKYFRKALDYDPHNYAIADNLKAAREKLLAARNADRKRKEAVRTNAARRQAESAKAHGQRSRKLSGEQASREAQRVFDRKGTRVPSSGDAVNVRDRKRPAKIPDAVLKHPKWKRLEKRETALRAEYETESRALDKLQSKRAGGTKKKADLLVEISRKKDHVFKLESKLNQVKAEKQQMLDLGVKFSEEQKR